MGRRWKKIRRGKSKVTLALLFLFAGSDVLTIAEWWPNMSFTSFAATDASQSACTEMKKEIQKQLVAANFCQSDADCTITTAFSCTLGEKYHLFNAHVNLSIFEEKIKPYQKACDVPDCSPLPPPRGHLYCVNAVCMLARIDRVKQ